MAVREISPEEGKQRLIGEIKALKIKESPVGLIAGQYIAKLKRMSLFELAAERRRIELILEAQKTKTAGISRRRRSMGGKKK